MTDTHADMAKIKQTNVPHLNCEGSVPDYFALLKPRVMSLVVFTAFVGIVTAPGTIHPWLGAMALLAIAVGAGASGALNMWYDADIDAVMKRTANRPVPAGSIKAGDALGFGLMLSAGSVFFLGVLVNWAAAALLAFTIFFYAVVYTMWLKRSTPHNIVIGGAAGALPPMVGWASVTGGVDLVSISLFMIIFLWTPPHFWALCLSRSGEYERANIPMLPVVAGVAETRRQIWLYTLIMAPVTFAPAALGAAGWLYAGLAIVLNAVFIWFAWKIYSAKNDDALGSAPRNLFKFSILYLFLLFSGLLAEWALNISPFSGIAG